MKIIQLISVLLIVFSCSSKKWDQQTFKVWGNCEMCKETIEGSLKIPAVQAAIWDVDSKIITVRFDAEKITLDSIQRRIADAGYDSDGFKGSDKAYAELPDCCQYERK